MNQKVVNLEPEKLTKGDITKSWIRWFAYSEVSNSYERLQALAFCGAMSGILEKLYKNKEDLALALQRHLTMYNTQCNWGSVINGIAIALEEKAASHTEEDDEEVNEEVITGIKTGLMGPIAGIGDTIDYGTLRPILMGIFIPFALAGSAIAALLPLIIQTVFTGVMGYTLYHKGYTVGKKSIIDILQSGQIQQVITGAGVVGMFMMGALSASYVKLTTPMTITTSVKVLEIQSVIDTIAPKLLPLVAVLGVYLYLIKVGPNYVKIVGFLILISLAGSAIGIF
ncbi:MULTISPECIES: PTS system mannose/fructose/sorbose family transporter subunit IID [Pelosinus]|uniref:PTS system mannose/fructose/sorbose family IID component n=1 Tax=Pelosinus fermentans B4 TaxID=1149862 RepID=I8RLB0_9FIRM|nr:MULTISPECIES: PTS system mannose/fructose/sorbose family transporter subunit IID [Pelosinus]EIW19330.1 PTS system mannose/fructose/sorbose family IID component [Pelosinus fermentans B4]EIW24939.1 PTS system mannose/fructose/sorbose family IID component [Pelosinus fermentans A11]OAM96331.1 PTS system mannose/fructose/sorbose family IID component [Pelosinus fermentans DSM 17108]SDR38961.1 PTS system IID component, Man family [Pelosinus fermentans]